MATADAICAAIAAEQRSLDQGAREEAASDAHIKEAEERRKLRRQLNKLRQLRGAQSLRTSLNKAIVESLDNDDSEGPQAGIEARGSGCELGECQMSCSEDVVRKEHLWKIEGMSWLTTALDDMNRDFVSTPGKYTIAATGDEVDFVYHPCSGVVDCMDDGYGDYCASLAMRFWRDTCSTLRYRVFIRRRDGEFVQWGSQGDYSKTYMKT